MSSETRPKRKSRKREAIPIHVLPVQERLDNFNEVILGYQTVHEIIEESERCLQCGRARCIEGCPINCNIPAMLRAVQEGKYEEANEIVHSFFAFPRSLHRICPALCQQQCVAGKRGDPIQIEAIIRFLADHYGKPKSWFEKLPPTGKKIAIIGAGPAGLTAAYELTKLGHEVTVFEKAPEPGGMLYLGIPEYRLPKRVLMEEIEDIKRLGVKFKFGKAYGVDFTHVELFEQGYDAILLAHGAHLPKNLGILGEDLDNCMHAIEFLRDVALGRIPNIKGKKLAIIGGGDVAIDAARVAKRLGAEPIIMYRRTREQMPAIESEIEDAEAEGIPMMFLVSPVEIIGDEEGKVKAIRLIRMELTDYDKSGRPYPVPIPGTEFEVEVDWVIPAISQEPEFRVFQLEGFKLTRKHTFEVDKDTNMTSIPGVFAAGDNITGPYLAITAIAEARKAVKAIHRYVMSKDKNQEETNSQPLENENKKTETVVVTTA